MQVESRSGLWCVVDDEGTILATAPTEEHAKQQLARGMKKSKQADKTDKPNEQASK